MVTSMRPPVNSITTRDVEQLTTSLDALQTVVRELKEIIVGRPDLGKQVPMSSTIQYILDYRERYFVYIISPVALTLSIEDYGTLSVAPNNPVSLPYPPSTRIFATNITGVGVQQMVYILCTDHPTGFYSGSAGLASAVNISQVGGTAVTNPLSVGLAAGGNTIGSVGLNGGGNFIGYVGSLPLYPGTAVQANAVGTATAGTATATLTGIASRSTYLITMIITAITTATAGSAELSLSGVANGPLTFEIDVPGTAGVQAQTVITFPSPIQSSAQNTNIVATLPTLGAGTGKVSVVLVGFTA